MCVSSTPSTFRRTPPVPFEFGGLLARVEAAFFDWGSCAGVLPPHLAPFYPAGMAIQVGGVEAPGMLFDGQIIRSVARRIPVNGRGRRPDVRVEVVLVEVLGA